VGTDQHRLENPINSTAGACVVGLGRSRLLSVALGQQLPRSVGSTEGAGPRPRLTLLAGGGRSDVELMQCFRAGDWGGFEALYDRYFDTAYLICRQILTCDEAALDSTHDTFLAMLAHCQLLDPYRLCDWLRDTAYYLAERRAHRGMLPSNGSGLRLFSCYARNDDRETGDQP
jgi:hypothetical protein